MGNSSSTQTEEELAQEYETLCQSYNQKTGARQIKAATLLAKIEANETLYILDTRGANEHSTSTLPNARLLVPSIGVLSIAYTTTLPDPTTIPDDATIVCHCTAGLRSGWAAVDLEKKWNRPVYSLHGGIVAWSNAGGQLEVPVDATTETPTATDRQETKKVHTYSATWGKFLKNQANVNY
jgi:rhodanese-related sulfurtransferase